MYTGITPAFVGKFWIFSLEEEKEHLEETNPLVSLLEGANHSLYVLILSGIGVAICFNSH